MNVTADRLSNAIGDRYRIERELGAGGMATVYLAADLKHDRKVAIKVLRPELAAVIGAERFLAEIKTTANLQHPHILPLHDSGEVQGTVFYVMPFVTGESLRDRLQREKQLPIAEAVRITTEVASALDYAHRHAVIHRDIKPENILLHDGQALVADFGIALAAARSDGSTRMTETGMSLGTPHYMSPEQAMGERDLDARTDVYALGCVAYEMLVGEPPFSGPTAQAIVAKVMTATPEPISNVRKTVPPSVEDAVHTALQKLPADRFATAREFAEALGGVMTGTRRTSGIVRDGPVSTARWLRDGRSIAALIALAALGMGTILGGRSGTPAAEMSHKEYLSFPDSLFPISIIGRTFAISPDGHEVVYPTTGKAGLGSVTVLMRKRLNQLDPIELAGTSDARWPEYSPDGSQLAFVRTVFAQGALQAVSLTGGQPRTLVADSVFIGISWGTDGYIYFSRLGAILRIPAVGGRVDTLTAHQAGSAAQDRWPVAVPDGRGVLFTRQHGTGAQELLALGPGSREPRQVMEGIPVAILPSGVLIFTTDGRQVSAVAFDLDRLEARGNPVLLASDLRNNGLTIADAAFSASGSMLYWSDRGAFRRAYWVDREGVARQIDPSWRTPVAESPAISPDGRRLAISSGNALEVKQLDEGPATQVVRPIGGRNHLRPAWHPDGNSLLFYRSGAKDSVMRVRDDGVGELSPTVDEPRGVADAIWSPDGRWIVYRTSVEGPNGSDIYAMQVGSDDPPIAVAVSASSQVTPAFSPDGKWLAYASSEGGAFEIYLRPFPNVDDRRIQISVRGGRQPRWSRRSGELFYVGAEEMMMAVRIRTTPTLEVGTPVPLFRVTPYFISTAFHSNYDVDADGQRFAMVGTSGVPQVVRIDNWLADYPELQR
ncbi:MAG TPA: protein kinase [Gemmatimonadaceae bacterium]